MDSDNFFILINKQKYISSFWALKDLKKRYKKVGHTGTLDPYAEGLLVVGVNRALKLFQFLPKEKEYVFDITFGVETDSYDLDGAIVNIRHDIVNEQMIQNVMPKFVGRIAQVPSKFSALKVNGRRAYQLARENVDFELKERWIDIHSLELTSFIGNVARFVVKCSKGTYVRSLARDICFEMGVLGCVSFLKRTKSDGFSLGFVNNSPIFLDFMFDLYPVVYLEKELIKKLRNGNCVPFLYKKEDFILSLKNDFGCFAGLVLFKRGMLFSLCMI